MPALWKPSLWKIAAALLLPLGAAHAQDRATTATLLGPEWVPVETGRLAAMRGGFVTTSGLLVSFAVERSVHVDGALVSRALVNIPDIARITPEQAEDLARLSRTEVLQLGGGQALQGANGANGAALVLQNTLDGRHIQVQTTVDTAVNTLGLLQAINAADALGAAINGSRGGP